MALLPLTLSTNTYIVRLNIWNGPEMVAETILEKEIIVPEISGVMVSGIIEVAVETVMNT